jgi:hypothetical protein
MKMTETVCVRIAVITSRNATIAEDMNDCLVFQDSSCHNKCLRDDSHTIGVNRSMMFPPVSKITDRVFACPFQHLRMSQK